MRSALIENKFESFLRNLNDFTDVDDENNVIIFAVDNGDDTADIRVSGNLCTIGTFITVYNEPGFGGNYQVLENILGPPPSLGGTLTVSFFGGDPPFPDLPGEGIE